MKVYILFQLRDSPVFGLIIFKYQWFIFFNLLYLFTFSTTAVQSQKIKTNSCMSFDIKIIEKID